MQADDGSEVAYAFWMDWTQDGPDIFGLAFLARRGLDADGPSSLPVPAPSSSGAVTSSGVTFSPLDSLVVPKQALEGMLAAEE
jgi:hypothetical protein